MGDVLKVLIDRAITRIERTMDKHAARNGRTGLRKRCLPDRHHGCARDDTVQQRTGAKRCRVCFQSTFPSRYIQCAVGLAGSRCRWGRRLTKRMAPCWKNGSSLVGVVHQQVSYRITGVTRYDREDHFKKRLETDAKFSDTITQHLLSVCRRLPARYFLRHQLLH